MLTVRSCYAILALACLQCRQDQWVSVQEIADRTGIPKPYLQKILYVILGKCGLIKTKRGYRGGMALSRPATQITLLDVVQAVEGEKWSKRCLLGLAECSDERACPTHDFWKTEREKIVDNLNKITLAKVADYESTGSGGLKALAALADL